MLPLSMNDYMAISDDIRLTCVADSCFFHYSPPPILISRGEDGRISRSNGFQKEEGKNFGMHIIEKYSGDFWRDLLEIR